MVKLNIRNTLLSWQHIVTSFYFYRNAVLVGVQEYSATFFTQCFLTIFCAHTDYVFRGKVVKF